MDMEGNLGVDLILGRPFLRSAKARIDIGIELILGRLFLRAARARINIRKGEIRFRVGKENMFFRFKHREEQSFLIQQDSEGQALWGSPEPQPEEPPTT